MKDSELEKFKHERNEAYARRIEMDNICVSIKTAYTAGSLNSLTPLWHINKEDIDFDCQMEQLNNKIMAQGYSIIMEVKIDSLLNCMQRGSPEIFREQKLFHKNFDDTKICRVVKNWQSGIKLIPPTIVLNNMLGNKIFAADGKHRINVAHVFGAKSLPIIIPNICFSEVTDLLAKWIEG